MDQLHNIISQIGPFIVYSGIMLVFLLVITYFVNMTRAIAIMLFIASSAYYLFLATPDTRVKMDAYAKQLYTAVIGKNIDATVETIKTGFKNSIKGTEKTVKELTGQSK